MRKILFCALLCNLFFVAIAFAQDDSALVERYQAMWKEELMRQNGITESDFASKIEIKSQEIMHGETNDYYRVDFLCKWDWVEVPAHHQVVVRISSKDSGYGNLPLPRDTWFSKDDFTLAIEKQIYSTDSIKISPAKPLAFASFDAAKEDIMKKTGITSFSHLETAFYVPGKLPRVDGDPYINFNGTKGGAQENMKPLDPDLKGRNPKPAKFGNNGIVAPTEKAPPPSLEDPAYIEASQGCVPAKAPSREAMGICAPEPGDRLSSATCTKGWLNLVTGDINFWDDAAINY